MADPVGMEHGIPYTLGTGRAGVGYVSDPARDGKPQEVELTVLSEDGSEEDITLHVGDRFRIDADTWTLQRVDNPGTPEYVVWIAPV